MIVVVGNNIFSPVPSNRYYNLRTNMKWYEKTQNLRRKGQWKVRQAILREDNNQ